MAKVGAPRKLTTKQQEEVLTAFKNYITDNEDPTVVGFVATDPLAIEYDVTRDNIKDWQEFSPLVKRAIAKQEHFLLKNAGSKYNATVAIFRLKQPQHGYSDRIDSDITSGGEKLGVQLSDSQYQQIVAARARRANP